VIFNLGGGRPMQYSIGLAPQSAGVASITLPFRPYAVVARPGDGGVSGISSICTLYLIDPDDDSVVLAKRKASSGSDFTAMSSSDYSWDASTMTLTLRTAASSNTNTEASYFAIGR
jgi:hypothetical protein